MRVNKTTLALALSFWGAVLLPAHEQLTLTVDATMDIFQAGGNIDSSGGGAPAAFTFAAQPSRSVTFPRVAGSWTCQTGYPNYSADGETSGYCLSAGRSSNFSSVGLLSGYQTTDFVGALVGVFLEDTLPKTAPAGFRFYVTNSSEGGVPTGFLTLSPLIGQVFFIGDGMTATGTGALQTFAVPPTATHLYLGYVDNCMESTVPGCYGDNVGSQSVTVLLRDYVPNWEEPTLFAAPSARIVPSITYDATTASTLLFGGSSAFDPGVNYGDTWMWRSGWTQLFPPTSPSPRGGAGTAYDPTTGTVVLFGGLNQTDGSVFGDTWIWDGVTWTQQFPPASPAARAVNHSMVYDPITKTVLLFGGFGAYNEDYGGVAFGDTWEWNGTKKIWTKKFPSSSPSPRTTPLAYDPLTRSVVLFGGANGGGDCCRTYYNDTWTWDGFSWTQRFPVVSPPVRTSQSMAYDDNLGAVVVFGGFSIPGQGLNDTWALTGTTWKPLKVSNAPSPRFGSDMDFDPLTDGLLLFGGELTGDFVTNETWLLIPVPVL